MTKPRILLAGAGGHALACIDVVERADTFTIAGLVGTTKQSGSVIHGYPVLGSDDEIEALRNQAELALVCVGQIRTASTRIRLWKRLDAAGFSLPSVISPHAYVSRRARIGDGSIVMHGAMVNAGAEVGRNCIINSQALVEHDATVGDHTHIATGATVNGGVRVGSSCFVGSAAVIRQGVTIGDEAFIPMGARVVADWMRPASSARSNDVS